MLSEKLLFWPVHIPDYVIFLFVSGFMGVAVHFFLPNLLVVTLLYFPVLLAFEAVSRSPRFIGYINSRRDLVSFSVALILLLASFTIVILQGSTLPAIKPEFMHSNLSFLVIGLALGLALRQCWQQMALLGLVGKRRLSQILLVNALWSLGLIFYPRYPHQASVPWYLVGIAGGVLLHRGSRLRLTQAAAAYRRLEDIADAWPPREPAPPVEQVALKLLAAGRQLPSLKFRKLRRFIEESRSKNVFTKRLALISASVFRLEGEWDRAMSEASFGPSSPVEVADAHLLLLKVMSLDELGRSDEADAALHNILTSTVGKDCPLANSLSALKLAESTISDSASITTSKAPLHQMLKALDLRARILKGRKDNVTEGEESVNRFLGRFIEAGVPITASLTIDILGYCHLAAGYVEEAGVFFQRCLELDPAFSPTYLHLGDYFLFRNRLAYGSDVPSRGDLWHARACYHAAVWTERNPTSRIRRIANERLNYIAHLSAGRRGGRDEDENEPID
jgi:tetratricopeptide (TPR) repeat protein